MWLENVFYLKTEKVGKMPSSFFKNKKVKKDFRKVACYCSKCKQLATASMSNARAKICDACKIKTKQEKNRLEREIREINYAIINTKGKLRLLDDIEEQKERRGRPKLDN